MITNVLFRGIDVETDEWVYGYFVNCRDEFGLESDTVPEIISLDAERIYKGEYQSWMSFNVNQDTVGQWTGITDKHGNKIFEGDLIYIEDSRDEGAVWKVFWDSANLRWACGIHDPYEEYTNYLYTHPSLVNTPLFYEVIGTIWDDK